MGERKERYFYEYWGSIYDDMDQRDKDISGVVFATSASEAFHYLTEWYGDDNFESITIRATDLDYVYECEVNKDEH